MRLPRRTKVLLLTLLRRRILRLGDGRNYSTNIIAQLLLSEATGEQFFPGLPLGVGGNTVASEHGIVCRADVLEQLTSAERLFRFLRHNGLRWKKSEPR